jgi:metallo-beta-lactamase class B
MRVIGLTAAKVIERVFSAGGLRIQEPLQGLLRARRLRTVAPLSEDETMRRILTGLLSAGLLATAAHAQDAQDPLLKPIAAEFAARWLGEEAPVRLFGDSWLVGFAGLNVVLIKTDAGLILIDGAVPQGVRRVQAHIRAAGFNPKDIKFILSTEPHYDHAGGLAALARDSGATVVASPQAVEVLRRGKSGPDDPQAAQLATFPPPARLRAIRDGETLVLGKTVITARATPGHTAGSMSWTWRSCEETRCADMVFGSSLNPVSVEGYRFSAPANAGVVANFRRAFRTFRGLKCDVLVSAHPDQSGGDAKLALYRRSSTPNPFVDPGACAAYAAKFEALLDNRLAQEAGR